MIERNIKTEEKVFSNLKLKFNKIKELGWIESKSRGNGAGGITFEILLGKERENFEIPDYDDIEIKTTSQKGFKIGLFNSAPDNELFEIKRLISEYGYLNKDNVKVFRFYVTTKGFTHLPSNNLIKLNVDEEKRIVKLQIFNKDGILIEDKVSWSFELLQ